MTKFDHICSLPKIFNEHKLSILPNSRGSYVIGSFDAYNNVEYVETENILFTFPQEIKSIDPNNIYSESSAVHCAYISGIIEDLIQEEVKLTVSGRMSTGKFSFNVNNLIKTDQNYKINVTNSQCEIDAAFEGRNNFLILEAKNLKTENFITRQLYYPYRLWKNKLNKNIVPVFMTYSNDVYSFFVYEFEAPEDYNSIRLIKQKNYIISQEDISFDDIYDLVHQTKTIQEPKDIPIPQADKFDRLVDLLGLLVEKDLTKDDITTQYQFDQRQTDYYTNAGIYLGLIEKFKNPVITYRLTDKATKIFKNNYRNKYLSITKCIFEHEVFNLAMKAYLNKSNYPSIEEIVCLMKNCDLLNIEAESTYKRRAQTILAWLNWILELINV